MTPKKTIKSPQPATYDVSTPMLDKFMRDARKRLRFPRYYKKALNW